MRNVRELLWLRMQVRNAPLRNGGLHFTYIYKSEVCSETGMSGWAFSRVPTLFYPLLLVSSTDFGQFLVD